MPPAKKTAKTLTFDDLDAIRKAKVAKTRTVPIDLDEDGNVVEFELTAIGRRSFTEMSEAHEKEDGSWDDDFPPALVSACATNPPITLEEAKSLWDDPAWSVFDLDKLFTAALELSSNFRASAVK